MNSFKKKLIQKFQEGDLVPENPIFEQTFRGSVDRYSFMAQKISKHLGDSVSILDAGCGIGVFLLSMKHLGHSCTALDFDDSNVSLAPEYLNQFPFFECNLETEKLPFEDNSFDVIVCSQVFEHFTLSHLPPVIEMRRILKKGGMLFIDVPNVACFRNRLRLLKGKNITWDYEKHYLDAEPIITDAGTFFPHRHNREFTLVELELLFNKAGFSTVNGYFLKSTHYRKGFAKIKTLGTAIRDLIPSTRKTVMAIGIK